MTLEGNARLNILGHAISFNPSGQQNYDRTIQEMEIIVRQDTIGGRTISWSGLFEENQTNEPTSIIWIGDSNPDMTPNSITIYKFKFISGHNFWIGGKSIGGGSGTGAKTKLFKEQTINANSVFTIVPSDENVLNEEIDPNLIMVEVTVKDTVASSPTYNCFIPATMVATVAKNDSEIRVYNETSENLVFNILLKK